MLAQVMLANTEVATVTYRASGRDGRDVELRLALEPDAATVQDAWSRLSAAFGAVDPRSLEIVVRRSASRG